MTVRTSGLEAIMERLILGSCGHAK